MLKLLQELHQALQQAKDVVVATIIHSGGSTPRTAGTRMLLYQNGNTSGTIGGGSVEADVIRIGRGLFSSKNAVITAYNLSGPAEVGEMDLICGGRMQILLEYIDSNEANQALYQKINEELESSTAVLLITRIVDNGDHVAVERAVRTMEGQWFGSFDPPDALQESPTEHKDSSRESTFQTIGDYSYFIESIVPPDTVYLVGGGHVSKELAALLKQVDFRVVVFDDREEFANQERFPLADQIVVRENFQNVFAGFHINSKSCIVIITRGHGFDKEVLAQALQTKAGYIGMIGSRKKKAQIYNLLLNEGVAQKRLDQVHCPIGLSIGAQTVPEIGISIAAELIEHRSCKKSQ